APNLLDQNGGAAEFDVVRMRADGQDSHIDEKLSFGNRNTGERVAMPHSVDDILTLGDLPEDGVLPVQVGGRHVSDEKLASIRSWSGIRHRKRAYLVLVRVTLELVGEAVT